MEELTRVICFVGALLALFVAGGLVFWLLGVGRIALIACLVDLGVSDVRHDCWCSRVI